MRRTTVVTLPATLLLALCACTEPMPQALPMDVWPKPVIQSDNAVGGYLSDRLTAVAAISCILDRKEGSQRAKYKILVSLIEATNHKADDKKKSPAGRAFTAVFSERAQQEDAADTDSNCGYSWNSDATRQLFNDDITKMAASKDDSQGNAHVGYVDRKGKFHDLSGFKEGGYGYADHQVYPVFIPGTDRIAYRVDNEWRSVKSDGTNDRHEGRLTFEGPFYFNGLNNEPVEVGTQNSVYTPDGSAVMDIRPSSKEAPRGGSSCVEPVGITRVRPKKAYICVSEDREQLNRITVESPLSATPLLPQNHHKVISAAPTMDGKRVIFIAQMGDYERSLYVVSVNGARNEPRVVQKDIPYSTILVSLRQYR